MDPCPHIHPSCMEGEGPTLFYLRMQHVFVVLFI